MVSLIKNGHFAKNKNVEQRNTILAVMFDRKRFVEDKSFHNSKHFHRIIKKEKNIIQRRASLKGVGKQTF